jgi:hypothetical protein
VNIFTVLLAVEATFAVALLLTAFWIYVRAVPR